VRADGVCGASNSVTSRSKEEIIPLVFSVGVTSPGILCAKKNLKVLECIQGGQQSW